MKIKQITYRNRRDFKAIFECENCGFKKEDWGYDDRFYHDVALPDEKCEQCGKSRNDLGIKGEFTPTLYPDWMEI